MTRWWLSVALSAAWLAQGAAAPAQYLPAAPSAAPCCEPAPLCPSGPAFPGPITSRQAPPVDPECMSLPAHLPGAFQDRCECEEHGAYFHFGAQGMQRQPLGNGSFGVFDAINVDTGRFFANPRFVQNAVNPQDIDPDMAFGPRATVGYLWGSGALEATGFYIPDNQSSFENLRIGQLNSFFVNPPLGFEGNNGLWLQADRIRTQISTTLASGEVNYRAWSKAQTGAELILGVRYLFLRERFTLFTDDDAFTARDIFGNPDPTRQADYTVGTRNNIVAPQAGFEYAYPVHCYVSLALTVKGAWGVNFYNQDVKLTRGDGFVGKDDRRHDTLFAHMYEVGAFADIHLLERAKLRAGYMLLWVLNVPEAVDQVNFDLSAGPQLREKHGSILYHGPTIELQFLF